MPSRRVTIQAVAREAGRSISTVSAALNGAPGVADSTRAQIMEVAERLGYRADPRARLMRAAHTGIIGVSYFPGQAFQAELVDALYAAAARLGHGLSLAACTPRHSEAEGITGLVRDRCEAVIVVDSRVGYPELAAAAGSLPLLMLCRESPAPTVAAVRSQDEEAVVALVGHVVASGRHEIVYVDGGAAASSGLRTQAYREAMRAHGLPARVVPGGDTPEAGIAAVEEVARAGRLPQALLAYNDHAALGALLELRRRGLRVPQDVAVAGFDGIAMTALSAVDLTTVRQDVDVIAQAAVGYLLGELGCAEAGEPGGPAGLPAQVRRDEAGGAVRLTVPAALVPRGTTAPLA